MADTSGASFGAVRSGLYTRRSIVTLTVAQNSGTTANNSAMPSQSCLGSAQSQRSLPVSSPTSVRARNEPSMNTSPWAKLISSMIP